MASLWDLLMNGASLTGGAQPQQQSTGLLSALTGSTAAPMGSGFTPGQATPQAPATNPAPQPPASGGALPAFASGQFPTLNLNQKPQGFGAIRPAPLGTPAPQDDDDTPAPSIASGLAAGANLAAKAGLPTDIRPAAQVAGTAAQGSTSSPGFLDGITDRFRNIYGNGGAFDPLINLGIGMNSGPGGTQRALEMTSNQQQQQKNNALQQLNMAVAQAKIQQQQAQASGQADYLQSLNPNLPRAQAMGLAGSGAVNGIAANQFKTPEEKAQLVSVTMPDGSTQQQWMTPGASTGTPIGSPATKTPDAVRDLQFARQNWQASGLPDPNDPKNVGFWQDFATKRLAGGGANMSVSLPPAEKASDMAYGQAEGKHFGDILAAGDTARQTQSQLTFMNDAFNQGGGNISTGPFAKSVLAGKQAILNATGIDLGGVPESEVINKLGFGLATNLVKEISQRPAQQEFIQGLRNVPGLLNSPQGSRVLSSIANQQSQTKIDLGELVQDPDNRKNWAQTVKNYYATHPYISPFTGKPLNVGDLNDLRASAQQAGIDPVTGNPVGGRSASPSPAPAPAVPSWSIVGD